MEALFYRLCHAGPCCTICGWHRRLGREGCWVLPLNALARKATKLQLLDATHGVAYPGAVSAVGGTAVCMRGVDYAGNRHCGRRRGGRRGLVL